MYDARGRAKFQRVTGGSQVNIFDVYDIYQSRETLLRYIETEL
jgi:hypothetical protein